jgi:predicted acylesterase/phospholipase RssA
VNNSPSVVFQSAKLGDIPKILEEFDWAAKLLQLQTPVGRVYGLSGGALVALAFSLARAAQQAPQQWGKARFSLDDFSIFLRKARGKNLRAFNFNPKYGPFNLNPLRRWVANRLRTYCGRDDLLLSELPLPLYLCAMDQDGTFTLFGRPDDGLQFQYQYVHVGPPQDTLVIDALIAALSTLLSTEPARVNGQWYRDCRPAIVDAGAIINDLEIADPRLIRRFRPYAPIRPWKLNFITSPFIMHSQHERNHTLLTASYLDLFNRQKELQTTIQSLPPISSPVQAPGVHHIQLPYVGSTEAFTNMRQSVEHKAELMEKFDGLLEGQLDAIPFDQTANIIYGAGGFSGILAGLVTTRAMNARFTASGGHIAQVYGVSAGVLNGFFHAVQLASSRYPDIYRPPAQNALNDLEGFIATITTEKMAKVNYNPLRFWHGFANLGPLELFLLERLAAYTGTTHPEQLTFDDIKLPLTVTAARGDGFTEYMGMTGLNRHMLFGGKERTVRSAPIAKAVIAGWSMNTYVQPLALNGELYRDGGGAFYDIGMFVAMLDPQLTNLINIHLDEPEGHSYHLPPRPDLVRIVFDTHNYYFPEERRRMFFTTNLLYEHYRLRTEYAARLNLLPQDHPSAAPLPPDFRQAWQITSTCEEK